MTIEEIMLEEKHRESFAGFADETGYDLAVNFFGEDPNPYFNEETRLAFEVWCAAISSVQADTGANKFMVGQRVIVETSNGQEIGTILRFEEFDKDSILEFDPEIGPVVWVFGTAKGFSSLYRIENVKPLPNGQL